MVNDPISSEFEFDVSDFVNPISIVCSVCSINFDSMVNFVDHRISHIDDGQSCHGNGSTEEGMKCEVCLAKVFSTIKVEELKLHLENHLNNKIGSSEQQLSKSNKIKDAKSKIQVINHLF